MQIILIVDDHAPGAAWALAALEALDCDLISTAGGSTGRKCPDVVCRKRDSGRVLSSRGNCRRQQSTRGECG